VGEWVPTPQASNPPRPSPQHPPLQTPDCPVPAHHLNAHCNGLGNYVVKVYPDRNFLYEAALSFVCHGQCSCTFSGSRQTASFFQVMSAFSKALRNFRNTSQVYVYVRCLLHKAETQHNRQPWEPLRIFRPVRGAMEKARIT